MHRDKSKDIMRKLADTFHSKRSHEPLKVVVDLALEAMQEISELREFVRKIMSEWPDGYIDYGDIESMADDAGILKAEEVTSKCEKDCSCSGFTTECFKKIYWLTEE